MRTKIWFGKFKGRPVSELPDDYLKWLLSIELTSPLDEAVREECRDRGIDDDSEEGEYTPPSAGMVFLRVKSTHLSLVRQIVDAGFKATAKVNHPDHGGSTLHMVELNAVAESLREQLGQLGGRN